MLQARREEGKIKLGEDVSLDIQNVLSRCPTPEAILDNLDAFAGEITESHSNYLIGDDLAKEESLKTLQAARAKLGIAEVEEQPKKVKRDLNPKKAKAPEAKTPGLIYKKKEEIEQIKEVKEIKPKEVKMPENVKDEMDFDAEMEALEEKIKDPEVSTRDRIVEALAKIPGAPDEKVIGRWKLEHGQDGVHVTVFSEREIYIYRHLTRSQWTKVQEMINKMQTVKSNVSEDELKEKVVRHCILWPKLEMEWTYSSRAGVLDALYQAIMLQSYFLSPQQVAQLSSEL